MQRSWLKLLAVCAGGVGICVLIIATGPQPLEASLPEERPLISIQRLERSAVTRTLTAHGTLAPRQSLRLTTRVPGEITWVNSQLVAGGRLQAGDELFRIDDRDYVIAVASAEARYEQAEATIDLEAGRSEIARLEWLTWQEKQGKAVEARPLALRKPQQAEAAANRKIIAAELDQAKLALQRTSIRAPWPASVVDAEAVTGQFLSVGEVTATLYPLDYAVVELQVPAKTVRLLDSGVARVELRSVHDPDVLPVSGEFEGIVRNLTEDTRLATVRVRVDNPLDHEGWVFGMNLEAKIVTQTRRSVARIPADLIVSGNLIWVYRDGVASRHQIYPVDRVEDAVLVDDNFESGDALIVERPIGLFDGSTVEITGETTIETSPVTTPEKGRG